MVHHQNEEGSPVTGERKTRPRLPATTAGERLPQPQATDCHNRRRASATPTGNRDLKSGSHGKIFPLRPNPLILRARNHPPFAGKSAHPRRAVPLILVARIRSSSARELAHHSRGNPSSARPFLPHPQATDCRNPSRSSAETPADRLPQPQSLVCHTHRKPRLEARLARKDFSFAPAIIRSSRPHPLILDGQVGASSPPASTRHLRASQLILVALFCPSSSPASICHLRASQLILVALFCPSSPPESTHPSRPQSSVGCGAGVGVVWCEGVGWSGFYSD